jgi:hypothetical protein
LEVVTSARVANLRLRRDLVGRQLVEVGGRQRAGVAHLLAAAQCRGSVDQRSLGAAQRGALGIQVSLQHVARQAHQRLALRYSRAHVHQYLGHSIAADFGADDHFLPGMDGTRGRHAAHDVQALHLRGGDGH